MERLDIEYWAAVSVQEQADQRALKLSHIRRTAWRFLLFAGALVVIVLSSLFLEYLRQRAGGGSISVWRLLGGMVPALLGLVGMLGVSAAFVREVYGISGRRRALGYVWLLLFGRAPFSLLDLLLGAIRRLFAALGLPPPPAIPFATYPHMIVREGRIEERYEDTPLARFGGPGNVVVFNDSAVFLERFGRLTRVAGPGAVFLQRFEHIREVLDLRPQERSEEVRALTKDGIPVRTEVQVRSQLARPPGGPFPPPPGRLHPVYKWAWTQAGRSHNRLVIPEFDLERENHWPERVMGNVGSTMRALIAEYRLDELLEPYEPDRDPRRKIAQRFREELDSEARNFGAQVLDVRMGALEPAEEIAEEVIKARTASWQALWKSRALVEKAKGEAEVIRQKGLARAYAQMEIILALTREFQGLVEREQALSAEFIALRFIEALRQAWTRPGGILMSFEAVRTLDYLQQLVKRDYALPRGEAGVDRS